MPSTMASTAADGSTARGGYGVAQASESCTGDTRVLTSSPARSHGPWRYTTPRQPRPMAGPGSHGAGSPGGGGAGSADPDSAWYTRSQLSSGRRSTVVSETRTTHRPPSQAPVPALRTTAEPASNPSAGRSTRRFRTSRRCSSGQPSGATQSPTDSAPSSTRLTGDRVAGQRD